MTEAPQVPIDSDGEEYPRIGQTANSRAKMPSHPSSSDMVLEAVTTLAEKGGSSLQAIKKYIAEIHKADIERLNNNIKKALKKLVETGKLLQPKGKGAIGSFKLPPKSKTVKKPAGEKNPLVKKVASPGKKKTTATPALPKKKAISIARMSTGPVSKARLKATKKAGKSDTKEDKPKEPKSAKTEKSASKETKPKAPKKDETGKSPSKEVKPKAPKKTVSAKKSAVAAPASTSKAAKGTAQPAAAKEGKKPAEIKKVKQPKTLTKTATPVPKVKAVKKAAPRKQ